MKMIKLSYRDYPELIRDLLNQLQVRRHEVDGEPEQVLTLWIAADGAIVCACPEPACKIDSWVYLSKHSKTINEIDVDWGKLLEELTRGDLDRHVR